MPPVRVASSRTAATATGSVLAPWSEAGPKPTAKNRTALALAAANSESLYEVSLGWPSVMITTYRPYRASVRVVSAQWQHSPVSFRARGRSVDGHDPVRISA